MPSKFKLQHLEYSTFVGLVRCGEEMVSLSTRILQFICYVNTDIYRRMYYIRLSLFKVIFVHSAYHTHEGAESGDCSTNKFLGTHIKSLSTKQMP